MWPFFQKTTSSGFEKICDNNKLVEQGHMYLLRDRRDGFEKNDYICTYFYLNIFEVQATLAFFVERFVIYFYKTSQETNWTKIVQTPFMSNKYKFLDYQGLFRVPKKIINNCSLEPEKSITIYNLFKIPTHNFVFNFPNTDIYNTDNIKQYITDAIKDAIKAEPSLVKTLPADLMPAYLLQTRVGGRRRRHLSKHHKKHSVKTRKMTR